MGNFIEASGYCRRCGRGRVLRARGVNHLLHLAAGVVCWPWLLAWAALCLSWSPRWRCERCGHDEDGPAEAPSTLPFAVTAVGLFLLVAAGIVGGYVVGLPGAPPVAETPPPFPQLPEPTPPAKPVPLTPPPRTENPPEPQPPAPTEPEPTPPRRRNPFTDPSVRAPAPSAPDPVRPKVEPTPPKPEPPPPPAADEVAPAELKPPPESTRGLAVSKSAPRPGVFVSPGISGAPMGLTAKDLEAYLDAKVRGNSDVTKRLIEVGAVYVTKEPVEVRFEQTLNGYAYVRPLDGPFKDKLVAVEPRYVKKE